MIFFVYILIIICNIRIIIYINKDYMNIVLYYYRKNKKFLKRIKKEKEE